MDKDGCTSLRITSFPSLWQNTREIPGEILRVYSGSWFQSFRSGLVGLLLWTTGTWCPGRKNKIKKEAVTLSRIIYQWPELLPVDPAFQRFHQIHGPLGWGPGLQHKIFGDYSRYNYSSTNWIVSSRVLEDMSQRRLKRVSPCLTVWLHTRGKQRPRWVAAKSL